MNEKLRQVRQATVAMAQGSLAIEPLLIAQDADLLEAMRRACQQPSTRLIGVTDGTGRVVGVVPVALISGAVVAHTMPEVFFADLADVEEVGQFGHAVEARTIGEIMLPPATIAPDATLGDAYRLMHQQRLAGLYVVDASGKPIGYVDIQELAMRCVEALEGTSGATIADRGEVQDPPDAIAR